MMFLAPGVDVAAAVEALGRKLGFTLDNGKYASVSLGQVGFDYWTAAGMFEVKIPHDTDYVITGARTDCNVGS